MVGLGPLLREVRSGLRVPRLDLEVEVTTTSRNIPLALRDEKTGGCSSVAVSQQSSVLKTRKETQVRTPHAATPSMTLHVSPSTPTPLLHLYARPSFFSCVSMSYLCLIFDFVAATVMYFLGIVFYR